MHRLGALACRLVGSYGSLTLKLESAGIPYQHHGLALLFLLRGKNKPFVICEHRLQNLFLLLG